MLCFYLFSFFLLERFWENTVANTTKAPAVNNIDSAALVISDADSSKINIKYLFVTLESVHLFLEHFTSCFNAKRRRNREIDY